MIRAVILAAGVGQRLRPHTIDRPKAMVAVGGESLLSRLAKQLARAGVEQLVIATGWHEETVTAALPSLGLPAVICRSEDYATTQNVVSFHACVSALAPADETWQLDSDLLLDDEIVGRLGRAALPEDGMLVAIDSSVQLGEEEMKAALHGDRVVGFGKKIPTQGAAESIGLARIGRRALSSIVDAVGAAVTAGETNVYYEDVYHRVLTARGGPVDARAVDIAGLRWTEIDTPADLARAEDIVS